MNLFAAASEAEERKNQPLAYRMRPRNLDEYIGQDAIIGKGRLLRRAIQADQLSSVIFYGPPGTGKTTLARVIANTTKRHFSTLNAVLSGVKELRYEIEEARQRLELYSQGTILFVDEVHRWNKSQQDALLPWVENGTVILIGATTENPYFEVNAALVSRSRIFQLKSLTNEDLFAIAAQALGDKERGYGEYPVQFEEGALEHLVEIANGDARSLLNALQLAVETSIDIFPPPSGTEIYISKDSAEQSIQKKAVLYDKEGDYHFDVISAFIKSIRGSDPDATLYWLARMVSAGEDPKFIFRRMLISACEDVGLADPSAIVVVQADAQAFERIGLPEGRFHLTHAALYLATTDKSNSTLAFFDALKGVEQQAQDEVPNHLRDGNRDAKGFGHGEGYLYPHAYQDHWVAQQYLPSSLQGKVYYEPSDQGYEKSIKEKVQRHREEQLESAQSDAFVENLSYSPGDKSRQRWVNRTISERGTLLKEIRERLFRGVKLRRSDRVLVCNAGHGMLLWEAYRSTPEGLVVAQVRNKDQADHINHYAGSLSSVERPHVYAEPLETLLSHLEHGLQFEVILGRNLLSRAKLSEPLLDSLVSRLAKNGSLHFAESVPVSGSRLSHFIKGEERLLLEKAETHLYGDPENPLTNWDESDLENLFSNQGLDVDIRSLNLFEHRMMEKQDIERYLTSSYLPAWKTLGIKADEDVLRAALIEQLANRPLEWKHHLAIIHAYREGAITNESQRSDAKQWKDVQENVHGSN
ncbi:AAA family ATPase [uncultured Sphaerochaeta sp.]|uniref:AAA family ATPase n=1 Tax=uncultured Sphaerochaeta sp. TaxID=886478 RepID=UPI0029CA3754|nr:AAA family ATPase [uncultured Sphaerochaeta sp.]